MRHRRPTSVLQSFTAAIVLGVLCPQAYAVILGQCTASASGVAFGIYDPLSPTALASTATVSVSCSLVATASDITIDLRTGASGSYASRSLLNGPSSLSYNLYQDSAHTQIWGNGTGGSTEFAGKVTPGKPSVSATVYGLLPASQDVAPGSYTDTITVTVNY